MPFRGRPPKPIGTRINRVKRAEFGVIEVEEGAKSAVPAPPHGLLPETQERWAAYFQSPVARAVDIRSDGASLERLARYWDEWARLDRDGELAQALKLELAMVRLEEQLGMTPMSRLKLGLVIGEAKMTAEKLRRMLRESATEEPAEDWESQWSE
jgi:hypothetical protein